MMRRRAGGGIADESVGRTPEKWIGDREFGVWDRWGRARHAWPWDTGYGDERGMQSQRKKHAIRKTPGEFGLAASAVSEQDE